MRDTEAKATSRYVMGGFGRGKKAYKRYAAYVEWLRNRIKQPSEHQASQGTSPKQEP